jgi:tetratricopeptide (TPR) repeat protein
MGERGENDPAQRRPRRPLAAWGVRLGVVAVLLIAGVAIYLAFFRKPTDQLVGAPPDPRVTYTGPFQNIHSNIHYVPDQQCVECHQSICETYAKHPMGRSLVAVKDGPHPQAGAEQNNPFPALGAQFRTDEATAQVVHRRFKPGPDGVPAVEMDWNVQYTLGSGGRGHSYLTERDGFLIQTPISWYTQKAAWDLSPGFAPAHATGRKVIPECLFCHVNQANHIAGTVNRYSVPVFTGHAIGCQRCHGPGERHVAARKRSDAIPPGPDYTIVNPRHLDRPLREAVCEQCHLQGEIKILARGREMYDYRPGLAPELFWAAFVRDLTVLESGKKAVGHVEQMYQSRCFQESSGAQALGCISCHDPHAKETPEQKVAHYRGRCLRCHADKGCSLPEPVRRQTSKEDSCIQCHMPRFASSDIPHTAVTDHRIVRRPDQPFQGGEPKKPRVGPANDGLPLVSFYRGRPGLPDAEDDRSRAIAAVRSALAGIPDPGRPLQAALPVLEKAAARDPSDLPAAEARAQALGLLGRPVDSLAAFEAILASSPEREAALFGAASAAMSAGQTDTAIEYWRRAVGANPYAPEYRANLVLLLVKREAWAEAAPASAEWVKLDPFSPEARTARMACLLATGDKAAARAEFAKLEALAPPNLRELQIRFERKLR